MRKLIEKIGFTPGVGLLVNLGMCLLTYLTWSTVPNGSAIHIGMQWLAFVFLSAVCGIMVLAIAVVDWTTRRRWGLLALPLAFTPYWLCMAVSSYMITVKAIHSDM